MTTQRISMRKTCIGLVTLGLALGSCVGQGDNDEEGTPLGETPNQQQWLANRSAEASETLENITVCPARNDLRGEKTVFDGFWGSYPTCATLCPPRSFAYRVNIRSLKHQGSCPSGDLCLFQDDVGMTSLSLHCFDRNTGAFTMFATSTEGVLGDWQANVVAPGESTAHPIVSGNLRYEDKQGSGDDTAANTIKVGFLGISGEFTAPQASPIWGTFRGTRACPAGQAVCGLRTQVESNVDGTSGDFDDSAFNGVRFECCELCPVGQEMCADNVCRTVGQCPGSPPPR